MKRAAVFILLAIGGAACSTTNTIKSDTNSTSVPDSFSKNLPEGFSQPTDDVGRRLLMEYGAVFVARGGATPPLKVVFKNDDEVSQFQTSVQASREVIGGVTIELQSAAMTALKNATAEAAQSNLTITPRGTDAGKRTYDDTVVLWASRVDPGLAHWTATGKIAAADAQRIKALSPYEQVSEIFKLESKGIFFSKDLQKSIIYSVAPPGASQHLSMLALDVAEFDNARVRAILAKHGWHQTVTSDLPHFTFLGVQEDELTKLGLRKVMNSERVFWVPDL